MLRTRPLRPEDQKQLWEWLHIALWDPPPASLRPIEVFRDPRVRIYAEAWGQAGDVGEQLSLTVHPQNPANRLYGR